MKKYLLILIAAIVAVGCTKRAPYEPATNYNVSYIYFERCITYDSTGNCIKYVKDSVGLIFNTTNQY